MMKITPSIPLPDWISLSQIVNWLVLGERPLEGELDKARRASRGADWEEWERRREMFERAKLAILAVMHLGKIVAFGRISTQAASQDGDWKFRNYVDHADEFEEIPSGRWTHDGIAWARGTLLTPIAEYAGVRIRQSDFIRHFAPEEADATDISTSGYSTPYLRLMIEAIESNKISNEFQPVHGDLVAWFMEKTINGMPVSQHMAKSMATFVRLPESARRGPWATDKSNALPHG
ncbi:MAG: hypothetical protein HQL42_17820 [Alphaproteobacteria bacterium]|nr:hypothetical protein [Alphaproteobacteria bacterium]